MPQDPNQNPGAEAKADPASPPANPGGDGGLPGTSQPPAGGAADPSDAGAVLDQFIQTLPENVREQAGKDLVGVRKGIMLETDYRQKTADISGDRNTLKEYRSAMSDPVVQTMVGLRFKMPDLVDPRYAHLAEAINKSQSQPGRNGSASGDGIPEGGFENQKDLVDHIKGDMVQTIQEAVAKAIGPLGQRIGGMEARTTAEKIDALEEQDPRVMTERPKIEGFVRAGLTVEQAFHAAMGPKLAADLTKTGRELDDARREHGRNLEPEPESGSSIQTVASAVEKGKSMVEIKRDLRERKLLPSQLRTKAVA